MLRLFKYYFVVVIDTLSSCRQWYTFLASLNCFACALIYWFCMIIDVCVFCNWGNFFYLVTTCVCVIWYRLAGILVHVQNAYMRKTPTIKRQWKSSIFNELKQLMYTISSKVNIVNVRIYQTFGVHKLLALIVLLFNHSRPWFLTNMKGFIA